MYVANVPWKSLSSLEGNTNLESLLFFKATVVLFRLMIRCMICMIEFLNCKKDLLLQEGAEVRNCLNPAT